MDRSSIGQSKSLQRAQVKLLEQVMKLSKDVKDIKEMILIKWKMEDERYGEYRWPYDEDGELPSNVNTSRRLN